MKVLSPVLFALVLNPLIRCFVDRLGTKGKVWAYAVALRWRNKT